MSARLVPCTDCQRHIRIDEAGCPFCGASLPTDLPPVVAAPKARLGRAALFAFGAAAVGVVAVGGCGDDSTVALDFTAIDAHSTRVELTHVKFLHEEARSNHEGGWGHILDKLAEVA